jgi:YidC/Oxa1 family membrane protein insertase
MQQDPESQRNLVLAIALSLGVLLGWQFLYAGPRAKAEADRLEQVRLQQAKSAPAPVSGGVTLPGATAPVGSPGAGGVPAAKTVAPVVGIPRAAALSAAPRVAIETPSLSGSINLRGGSIDDLLLKAYRETIKPDSANVVLLQPAQTAEAFFTEFGWIPVAGSGAVVPGADTVWVAASTAPLSPQTPVVLSHDNGQGLVFRRTFSVDDKYMFTIRDEVDNKSGRETALAPYGRIYRFGTPKTEGWAILHEGLIGWIGNDRLQEIGYGDLIKDAEKNLKDKRVNEASRAFKAATGGWLGFTDKYWSAVLVPPQDRPFDAQFSAIPKTGGQNEIFWANFSLAPLVIPNGSTGTAESRLFGGAKQPKQMDAYGSQLGIAEFGKMVDWGYLHFITKPLFWVIDRLYGILGNFGLAILAVTLIVKGIFFPLQSKSYESMAKMKKLQPEMEKIREQFKDDKARQQQELMELYKKQKINPAAGCLPVLLQIPVFFALYKVLFVTIDMRQAPFFGWIKDLSAPDPTSLFNLFGLLPFDPSAVPVIGSSLMLGVWPLLMGITMWIQMQLNPQQPDPLQQKIFNWMPVMFTFMLASFPVGLVIYWSWSNVLSLAQQYYITKKAGAEIHLWKNLGIDAWLNKRKAANSDVPKT